MATYDHPYEIVDLDGYQAKIDVEIVDLIKAVNKVGWITTMSCQDNIDNRVWIQFKEANHAELFMFCIAAKSVYKNNGLALKVLGATTQKYDKSDNSWHLPGRWWVDANVDSRLWAQGIEIHISIRFPRKYLDPVTKIMKKVAKDLEPKRLTVND